MLLKAMILGDGTLRIVSPVDLKNSVGERIVIELVGIVKEEEQFYSEVSLPVLKEIWGDEPEDAFGKPIR